MLSCSVLSFPPPFSFLAYVGLYETGNYNPLGNAYPLLTLCLNLSVGDVT